jgi:hypothetical protein
MVLTEQVEAQAVVVVVAVAQQAQLFHLILAMAARELAA